MAPTVHEAMLRPSVDTGFKCRGPPGANATKNRRSLGYGSPLGVGQDAARLRFKLCNSVGRLVAQSLDSLRVFGALPFGVSPSSGFAFLCVRERIAKFVGR